MLRNLAFFSITLRDALSEFLFGRSILFALWLVNERGLSLEAGIPTSSLPQQFKREVMRAGVADAVVP